MISSFTTDLESWATENFAGSCPEDPRLARRLVKYATLQAADPTGSTARVCGGNKASQMAAYRFLENPRVKPASIDIGPFTATARACAGRRRLLAVQDTSSVSVMNSELREELASSGSPTGFAVHTVVMVDGDTGEFIGPISQQRWLRKGTTKRFATASESDKWLSGDTEAMARLAPDSHNVITVADREADILAFLHAKAAQGERFVLRAKHNRAAWYEVSGIFGAVRRSPPVGHRDITIEQRGAVAKKGIEQGRMGRARRTLCTALQAVNMMIVDHTGTHPPIEINVVRVALADQESTQDRSTDFEWILLTTEPIDSSDDVTKIVEAYEHRWVIEELHKCWKTGCRLEQRPLQTVEAVETMIAITLPIATRLLRLTTAARSDQIDHNVCAALSDNEAKCLWHATEKGKYPDRKPTAHWALLAIAKMGGWYDSKRTGRVGWQTLWHGWDRFSLRLSGWNAALGISTEVLV
jgi:hypothetical protein